MAHTKAVKEPIFCLDSGAITHGANLAAAACVVASAVIDEFRPGGATRRRLDQLLAAGARVAEPTDEALARVDQVAAQSGQSARLSLADRHVVALATDLGQRACIVSDDHTVLDLASRLGVRVQPIHGKGITSTRDWVGRCRGCGREAATTAVGTECRTCGAEIVARVRKP